MKKRKLSIRIYLFLFLLAMFLSIFQVANLHADKVDSRISVLKSSSACSNICKQANNSVGKTILTYKSAKGILIFSNKTYSKLSTEKKNTFMETALLATKKSELGKQQKSRIYNFIEEQDTSITAAMKYLKNDTSADFVEARNWFRPFSGPISTLMGFLCIVIDVFIGLSILFDLAYLSLPAMQLLLERGEPNKRPFGVSIEAWKTNREAENFSEKSTVMSMYVKKRIPSIILVSACLGYVVSGKIYDLITYFINAFSI